MSYDLQLEEVSGQLKEILEYKILELEKKQKELPLAEILAELKNGEFIIRDFVSALDKPSQICLIAEVKKSSPSLGDINVKVDVVDQARKYEQAGADAISVLTDKKFFKGDIKYLQQIKNVVNIPVLHKDFIFDPYQVYEAKLYGADAILLMATILPLGLLIELVDLTHSLGIKCLLETHTTQDLAKALQTKARVIGINARDLKTFRVNSQNVIDLASQVPADRILIAESGIESRDDVLKLKKAGAKGILVGTTLMKSADVMAKIRELKSED